MRIAKMESQNVNFKQSWHDDYLRWGCDLFMQGRTWDSIPVPGISVKDLDKDALNVFKKKAVELQRLDKKSASVSLLNLLLNLHCVCKQWLVNRNAVILATRGSMLFSITVWILLRRMTIPNH